MSRGRSLLVSREIDGKAKCGTTLPNCSLRKTGVQREDTGVMGRGNDERLWLEKWSNSRRRMRRRKKKVEKKKKKKTTTTTMMMMMTTINAY
jgi:CelD/BcsL family acetyltransferase involved in cellulose biosynthesis